jgi:hypothetical protein
MVIDIESKMEPPFLRQTIFKPTLFIATITMDWIWISLDSNGILVLRITI